MHGPDRAQARSGFSLSGRAYTFFPARGEGSSILSRSRLTSSPFSLLPPRLSPLAPPVANLPRRNTSPGGMNVLEARASARDLRGAAGSRRGSDPRVRRVARASCQRDARVRRLPAGDRVEVSGAHLDAA